MSRARLDELATLRFGHGSTVTIDPFLGAVVFSLADKTPVLTVRGESIAHAVQDALAVVILPLSTRRTITSSRKNTARPF